jgi:ABC-type multidrug transport system, permease component
MVIRRESGVLKRVRATPLPPTTYLLAVLDVDVHLVPDPDTADHRDRPRALPRAAAEPAGLTVRRAGRRRRLLRRARPRPHRLRPLREGSSAVVNFIYLPMAIISGTFFSPQHYPGFLKAIANVLPLTYFTRLTRDVMVHDQHLWADRRALAIVAAWGVAGLIVAVRRFSWQPREA